MEVIKHIVKHDGILGLYSVPRNHCNVCDFQHSLLIPLQQKLQKFYNLY